MPILDHTKKNKAKINATFIDGDGDTLVCNAIDASMGQTSTFSLDNENYTPPMGKDIVLMSSFPGKDVAVENGMIPIDTTV